MATLNITYNGLSVDYPLDVDLRITDGDVRRIAVEVLRGGGLRGVPLVDLPTTAFDHYVIDRFHAPGSSRRIYLRPKVPFGAS